MTVLKCLLIVIISISTVNCKVVPVFYEKLEYCASKSERANVFDLSKLEIIAANDTDSFINGSWKFLKELKSPWIYHMYVERYIRGEWFVEIFDRHVPDMCTELHNPTQPWYFLFSKVSNCPMKAGSEWKFDMLHQDLPFVIPPNLVGKWRLTNYGEFKVDGVTKKECIRVYYDLFDV